MKDKFDMNELGLLSYFFGMEVIQSEQGYFLYQKRFTMKLLNKLQTSHYTYGTGTKANEGG
jgi:hypothetical protein